MPKTTSRTIPAKEIPEYSKKLLEYLEKNSDENKRASLKGACECIDKSPAAVTKLMVTGDSKLREYGLIDDMSVSGELTHKKPKYSTARNTVTVPASYFKEFARENPDNAYDEEDAFEVDIQKDKIVLTRVREK
jgi:hypothetical protein